MDVYIRKKICDLSQAGGRLKYLRELMNVTQKELVVVGFGSSTVAFIETGRRQMSLKLASLLVELAKLKGIKCSPAWLITGEGEKPTHSSLGVSQTTALEEDYDYNDPKFLHEIIKFKEVYPDSFILKIKDESMAPRFNLGDHVGGAPIELNQLPESQQKACIIKLKNGLSLVGKVKKIPENGFEVSHENTLFAPSHRLINHSDVQAIYPVTWHRIKY